MLTERASLAHWKNGFCRPKALALLKAAPTPANAARLTRTQISGAHRRAGRQRGIEAAIVTERPRETFRAGSAHHPTAVEMGDSLGEHGFPIASASSSSPPW
ncbi:hypothetical protein OG311_37075 [Streptomyces sp. NBC_01343]|uniref:hypothetical protein n=1 Tax=Streptomyces sp. NBC_01343 TaxID=2903832 RepID=UPI002E14BF60|nr:hypothetical protein OG311_37075 [Streptomyces sp. NBC_01343]